MTDTELMISANRALLFNIIPAVKFICIVKNNDLEYILNIYSDYTLSEKEKDLYNSVAGEMAGDFLLNINIYTNFITCKYNYSPKKHVGLLVYARFENA